MDRVRGKVAVVTGAALGIGRAACRILAREGASIAVTDVLGAEGRALSDAIQADGGGARYWHRDVGHEAQVGRVMAAGAARRTTPPRAPCA